VEIYDYNFVNNPKFYERVGAPNKLIGSIFIDNFDKIKNKMSKLDLVRPNNTISVIKEVGDDLGLPYFMNYLEFIVLADDLKNFKIITSAFSTDGSYLRTFKGNLNSPKLFL
jgi:c-di-AMP phosphodiesterase-like protein